MDKKIELKHIMNVFIFIYFSYCMYHLYINEQKFQWDFHMQYHSAEIFSEGGNPYNSEILKKVTGNSLWYAYPPATLFFYRIFTAADYSNAYRIFLSLKIVILILLVILWRKTFLSEKSGYDLYLFIILSFNSTIFLDMRAGNINMLEEMMIWLAFYFYLNHKYFLFCVFILLSASFKMTPVVFIALILCTNYKNKYFLFANSAIAFLGYLVIQYAISPPMFLSFVKGANATLVEGGIISPSTISIIYNICNLLSRESGLPIPGYVPALIFTFVAFWILFFSAKSYILLRINRETENEKIILFLACLVYALLHPRMKDYAYMLLIVPSYYIINKTTYQKTYFFLFFASICSAENITLPGLSTVYFIIWSHYPLIIAYLIWGLYIFEISSQSRFIGPMAFVESPEKQPLISQGSLSHQHSRA